MRVAKNRNFIVALLMMVFIGQAVASMNISCQNMPSSSHDQSMDSAMMDHAQHMNLDSASSDKVAANCCPDSGCSLGGCVTAVLPESQLAFTPDLASLTNHYKALVQNQLTVSLFRPPISR